MNSSPKHPGQFVREKYLEPRKITVTDAAKLIGISRPGVSNFLNGRVSTTADMASRIERAFGIPASTLLDKQAEFDAAAKKAAGSPANTKAYVPPFLGIKSNDIVAWIDHNIPARTRFAVLLRTLVNSTGINLEKVDFPGNDDAERPGWDGFTITTSGTPWIPAGQTGWEFGVNEDVKSKADGDFIKSVKAYNTKAEREKITFVFVTPRRWPGKTDWVTDMKAKKQWKHVRAYDASDLEQWLEQSLAGQTWFANENERPSEGVRSLDKSWTDWADVAKPHLPGALFETAIEVARDKLKGFLTRNPGNPLAIAADSIEEALAFLSRIFMEPEFEMARDRVLVFDDVGVLPKLAKGSQDFIPVVHTRDVERELGPYANDLRSIVVYPRNATNFDPDITLEPLGYEAFRKGLKAMGYERDEATKLSNESGRSLTVLRRRLSKVEAVRRSVWAADVQTSSWLVPLTLVGAWNADNEADQIALSLLANLPFEELERRAQGLARLNDAPIWCIGACRGVVSKIDVLFAIAGAVTRSDLDRYLEMAKIVLGEDDPALDLPDKERWAAAIHGKRREFSGALRDGISETLVLLAVHGKHLFRARLGFDGGQEAAHLVRELLEPLTTRTLEANDSDLPVYAEAAPDTFLAILEEDLKEEEPAVLGISRPIDTSLFGVPCVRSGLLWAMEGLAWNPQTFLRSVLILGRLSEIEINDNWANKPIASLKTIFRSWMPQTAADHGQRLMAMNKLIERFPSIGWKVCVDQFGGFGNEVGHYSHKPKWRPDGYGFGEPKFTGPVQKFRAAMVELALSRPSYTPNMLCDLVARLHGLCADFQKRVWKLIKNWVDAGASDADIASVRETIRMTVLSHRGRRRGRDDAFATLNKAARSVYDSMEPTDLVNRHEWLFRQGRVEESADELDDDHLDFQKREERVAALRVNALREIFDARGTSGIFALAARGNAQHQIGWHLARDVLDLSQNQTLVLEALQPGASETSADRKSVIAGALRGTASQNRRKLFEDARTMLAEADTLRLLLLTGFEKATWQIVDQMSSGIQEAYWRDVHPGWIFHPDEEDNNEAVERLIKAKRPRAAFSAVHFKLGAIRPSLLVAMLSTMAVESLDKSGEYQLQEYDITTAFALLDRNPDATHEQKAGLELSYLEVLSRPFRGDGKNQIPNLERYIEAHPGMYIRAIVWACKRKGRGDDPPEYKIPEGREDLAERGYRLLEGIERIPGQQEDGSIDAAKLTKWITDVREASTELDRPDICDLYLGKLLSHAPNGTDDVWPCEVVRDVIEDLQSRSMTDGAHTALYNARGVHWRGEGGGQERELAAKYRAWSDALQFTHPFLASSLLMGMVKTYEREAEHQDTEAGIRRRLRH